MTADLDLTAAIEAGAEAIDVKAHEYRVDVPEWVPYCICGWKADATHDVIAFDRHVISLAIEAALPHIREALAQQASHEPTARQYADTLAATYQERWEQNSRVESERVLWEAGYRSGRDATARIVRGES